MNSGLEFHDSVVTRIDVLGKNALVIFEKAYIHQTSGVPGVNSGDLVLYPAILEVSEAIVFGSSEQNGYLMDGRLLIDETKYNLVSFPFECAGSVSVQLAFNTGQSVRISGSKVQLYSTGEGRFLERFHAT